MNSTLKSSSRAKPEPEPEPEPAVKKFLKIISLSTIKEKIMKIPPRFVRLGPKLFDTVTVETPAGFKRTIRIKRIGDEVWFENGWSEFAEAHSLSEGHVLYFLYKGNSSFRVVIFDVSASEIKYPLDKVNVIDSDDDEEVIEIIDDEKDGFTVSESSDNDSKEGVIDLEELVKKKPSFNINSETITIDDVEEIDSMDDVEEDKDILREE